MAQRGEPSVGENGGDRGCLWKKWITRHFSLVAHTFSCLFLLQWWQDVGRTPPLGVWLMREPLLSGVFHQNHDEKTPQGRKSENIHLLRGWCYKAAVITWRFFVVRSKQKSLFHFELRGKRSRCELSMKTVQRQAQKPQRDTWEVCEMFVLSLLWFMSLNHLGTVLWQL